MPSIWLDPKEVKIPPKLSERIGGHPLVAETLARRGLNNPEAAQAFLDPAYYTPTPAADLPGVNQAVDRLVSAIQNGETILVWGDFDVDGQTSTTLLVEALRELGAKITYHIPVRATQGHGIQVKILEKLISTDNPPNLLLTCDTGISAHAATETANHLGLDVIITDHHDLPEELPPAYAIIDPKMLPSEHPLATLPGVGVAYKLIEQLFGIFGKPEACKKYLDLVALGIVADVAEQRQDTRFLLQQGLSVLRKSPRLGLQILMEIAQIIPSQLDESTIGFGIGPRLNALGRLSDANPIVEFLTTQDNSRARVIAHQLEGLNERRRLLTDQITQAALDQIERDRGLLKQAALVLAHTGWHTGVIGIVASRLVERFGKPTILLSIGADDLARGSARSIEGVHITEAIASQKELLTSFGGHPGAAGLAMPAADIPQFRRGVGRAVQNQLGGLPPKPQLQIDAYLPISDLDLELVDQIERLAPFGAGNPALILASQDLRLVSHTPIGRAKEHLRLVVADQNEQHMDVLWWNGVGNRMPEQNTPFDLAFTIQANTFRGERQLQIQWQDYRPVRDSSPEIHSEIPPLVAMDFRKEMHPLARLKSIQSETDLQIWAEGDAKIEGSRNRYELTPGIQLAVWTTPPGPREWQFVLDKVKPQRVYLFAVDQNLDEPQAFIMQLAGLVKFALRTKEGEVELHRLAVATAQRESTVKMGLLWLEAKGHIRVIRREETIYWTITGDGVEKLDLPEITAELQEMLAETAAYRTFFKNNISKHILNSPIL